MGKLTPEEKGLKMKAKSEKVRELFNLADAEQVIQDYACSMDSNSGRLWVTQSYLCFESSSKPEENESIPFRRVTEIDRTDKGVRKNAITVRFNEGEAERHFTGLHFPNETTQLVKHLWDNPASFREPRAKTAAVAEADARRAEEAAAEAEANKPRGNFVSRMLSSPRGKSSKPLPEVDTQTTAKSKQLAAEIEELGAATLAELEEQAKMIDEVEQDMADIDNALNKADKHTKAVGSAASAMASSKKDKRLKHDAQERGFDEYEAKALDIAVLWKKPNDDLVPALLRLYGTRFECIEPDTGKVHGKCQYRYAQVKQLAVRARPFHLDVRFGKMSTKSRFRMMTAHIQEALHELYMRCQLPPSAVLFEPHTVKFAFGPSLGDIRAAAVEVAKGGFRRTGNVQQEGEIVRTADTATAQALQQQDDDLQEVSEVLNKLDHVANIMGKELERQTEQIEQINSRVDDNKGKMAKVANRIDDLL